MIEGAEACPFCGSDNLTAKSSRNWGWFVSCECNAVGPSAGSRDGAVERWNRRVEPRQGRLEI